jgi:hypothetical protein
VQVEVVFRQESGHRVDEERHVVGDDLDNRVVLLGVRLGDAQLQLARHALLGQFEVLAGGGEHLLRGVADEFLVRREAPETVDQGGRVVVVPREGDGLRHQALGVRHRLLELGVLDLVGGRAARPALLEKRVQARADLRGQPPRIDVVDLAGFLDVEPGGLAWPENGLRFDRRSPVHRCHSPRPTTLWVTLHPA